MEYIRLVVSCENMYESADISVDLPLDTDEEEIAFNAHEVFNDFMAYSWADNNPYYEEDLEKEEEEYDKFMKSGSYSYNTALL